MAEKAKADPILREKLLQTRENPNPIHAFCEICHAYGVSIYEMDLAMAGEEFTQKSNAAPMAAEKIPRRLKGKMTSMSCFWQR
ncbi:MAG: hypothetical protein ACLUI5_08210 [Fusicatenibacter saccharivorans]